MRISKINAARLTAHEGTTRKWKIGHILQSGERGGQRATESSNSLYLTFIFHTIKISAEKSEKHRISFVGIYHNTPYILSNHLKNNYSY